MCGSLGNVVEKAPVVLRVDKSLNLHKSLLGLTTLLPINSQKVAGKSV